MNMNATKVNASIYNLTNVVDTEGKRDARFEGKPCCWGMRHWKPLRPSTR